jgi:hypothetical protein
MSKTMEELWDIRRRINEEIEDMTREERRQYYQKAQKDYQELLAQIKAKEKEESKSTQ